MHIFSITNCTAVVAKVLPGEGFQCTLYENVDINVVSTSLVGNSTSTTYLKGNDLLVQISVKTWMFSRAC